MCNENYFNPRAPYGARLPEQPDRQDTGEFQSTRPIRGATERVDATLDEIEISIHAPHTGRDICEVA